MKDIIYYFSGTGNSLAIAQGIAEKLGDARIEPIGTAAVQPDADCESVGIVFPVYYYCPPTIVKRFAETVNLKGVPYVYGVASYGSGVGTAFKHLQDCIDTNGGRLSAAYKVLMPGNYLVNYGAFPDIYLNFVLKRSEKRTTDIAKCIKARTLTSIPQGGGFAKRTEKTNLKIVAGFGEMGERFTATDACTGCGICEKVCPVHNITNSENRKPVWGSACEQCMACIQWCPAQAIEYGEVTANRKRYHHTTVKAADLFRV